MASNRFDGKVVLATGTASGIGEFVARALAEQGAVVAAVDRDQVGVARVAKEIEAAGGKALAFPADVSVSSEVTRAVQEAEDRLGPIEFAVNMAGVLRPGRALSLSDEDWTTTFRVNNDGVFYVSRAVGRKMAARGRGSIVTVASNAAAVPRVSMAAYAASKAAATAFTKSLGLELAASGVRCNVVAPGSTDTPMLRSLWSAGGSPQNTIEGDPGNFRVGIPLGKLAQPSDVADTVIFLLSDQAAHITMQVINVDGGAALGTAA